MTPAPAPRPIHICGEALIDFVPFQAPNGLGGYIPKPGGSPYNVAIAAARAGGEPCFVGAVSTDLFGEMLHDHLVQNGVDCWLVERSDRLTTLAFVDLSSGSPRYAFHNEGTTNRFMDPRIPYNGCRSILHVGSISLIPATAGDRIVELTRRHLPHGIISFDPNVRSALIEDRYDWTRRVETLSARTSVLKLSIEDIDYLRPGLDAEEFAARRLLDGVAMVIVTLDSEGAFVATAKGTVFVKVPPRMVRDTVGCGDTLMGAVLVWLSRGHATERDDIKDLSLEDLDMMLRFAVTAASLNCEAEGCDPPTRVMIEERLASEEGTDPAGPGE